jgi:membrane associated rhomboid family serine protease
VEAQTDIHTYLEQGKGLLAQGQARDAAIAYARAAQLEPSNPMARLGLAEANLALGDYNTVRAAASDVQQLQPAGGIESLTAQALLDVLDKRYDRALQQADAIVAQNPGVAYVHALRSYLLRLQRQDYDANLARARAARLSYGGRFENCFPPAEPVAPAYAPRPVVLPTPTNATSSPPANNSDSYIGYTGQPDKADRPGGYGPQNTTQPRREREQVPTWTRPNQMQRQMIRTRFTLSQYPGLVTYALIAINLIVFLAVQLSPTIANILQLDGASILGGQYWRFLTAIFVNTALIQIAFNSFSLFFVGRSTEIFYGKWRYLVIYLLAGILSGVFLFAFFTLQGALLPGISTVTGGIFGVFGAFGTFFLVNRRSLGIYARGAITNWVFWLSINLVFGLSGGVYALLLPVSSLIIGMLLGLILVPRLDNRRRF